jgi:hypothetical protein
MCRTIISDDPFEISSPFNNFVFSIQMMSGFFSLCAMLIAL